MWFVEPKELKAGGYRLVCESDEDGGFWEACKGHTHPTAEEAARCEQGRAEADKITGIPRVLYR